MQFWSGTSHFLTTIVYIIVQQQPISTANPDHRKTPNRASPSSGSSLTPIQAQHHRRHIRSHLDTTSFYGRNGQHKLYRYTDGGGIDPRSRLRPAFGENDENSNYKHASFIDGPFKSIDTPLDEPVYMHCRIRNRNGAKVAWMRDRDSHVLTVDNDVFTADRRFQISINNDPQTNTSDWMLIIRYAKTDDSGTYICQLSTETVQIHTVNVTVFKNTAEMRAEAEQVVVGNEIVLTCVVHLNENADNSGATVINNVEWFRHGAPLADKDDRFYVKTSTQASNRVIHKLRIKNAKSSDHGVYTCKPDNAPSKQMLIKVNERAPEVIRKPSQRAVVTDGTAPRIRHPTGDARQLTTTMTSMWLPIIIAHWLLRN